MDLLCRQTQEEIHNSPCLHSAMESQLHPLALGRANRTCWSFYWSFRGLDFFLPMTFQ